MVTVSALGILIGLALLTFAAWKKINVFAMAVVAAGVVGVMGGTSLLKVLEGPFREGFATFASTWILIFCISAVFGKLYENSGAAWRIADTLTKYAGEKWSLIVFIIVSTILIYGGISVFVILFLLVPLGRVMFEKANIPWYLFPSVAAFACGTYAMSMLPGTLQIQNMIPTKYLGTDLMSAPIEGIIGSIFAFIVGTLYILWQAKRGRLDGPERRPPVDLNAVVDEEKLNKEAPIFLICLIPMIVTLILINILKMPILYGVTIGCLFGVILFNRSTKNMMETVTTGFQNGIMPTIIVGGVVGVGRAIALTPAYAVFKTSILAIPISGLTKVAAVTTISAGITGSASGGLSLSMEMFSKEFLSWGFSPEIIHRVASVASGGMDTLPWNTFVILAMGMAGVSYSRGYSHMFFLTVILPLLTLIPIIITYTLIH